MTKNYWLLLMGFMIIAIAISGLVWWGESAPSNLDGFAACLKEKGATFYGAFWCPHCQNQKSLFGRSARLLPYVECSNPDGNGQNAVCNEKKIAGYPTWEYADGVRETGEISLARLSEKTGCILPQ